MFIRISKNNILRTPGKTALFVLLITALTLSAFLCIFTYRQTVTMTNDYKRDYITIASVESITAFEGDDKYIDFSPITSGPYVLDWQPNVHLSGLAEGFVQTFVNVPYAGETVAIVGNLFYDDHINAWTGIVRRTLSCSDDIEGKILYLRDNSFGFEPVADKTYVIHGTFAGSSSSLDILTLCGVNIPGDEFNTLLPFAEIPDVDAFMTAGESDFFVISDFYDRARSAVDVLPIRNLDSNLLFHQKSVTFAEGRGFTDEEYETGARVCIISAKLAAPLNIGVGDTLRVMVYGGAEVPVRLDVSRPYLEYEVIGIVNTEYEKLHYVFMPENTLLDVPADKPLNCGTLYGQAVLKNGSTSAFLESIEGIISPAIAVTVYDHGYESVVRALSSLGLLSLVLSGVSILVCAAVLLLYGYLFVERQRETVRTMLYLGTPRKSILTYLLFGSTLISFVSAAVGSVAGALCGSQVFNAVYRLFASVAASDRRFSNTSVGIIIEKPIEATVSPLTVLSVFLLIFLISFVFCCFFASRAFEKKRRRKLKTSHIPRPPRHASMLPPGALKYALLSFCRGGRRSLAVVLLAFVLVSLLGTVAYIADSGENEVEAVYDSSVISGRITDLSGSQTRGLTILSTPLAIVSDSGYIENVSYSISDVYKYLATISYADGREPPPMDYYIPEGGYALESYWERVNTGPQVIFTNNFAMSPEIYGSTPAVQWLDGYDESVFESKTWEGDLPCAVSRGFADEHGLAPGDVFQSILTGSFIPPYTNNFNIANLKIIAVYINPTGNDTMYLPMPEIVGLDRRDYNNYRYGDYSYPCRPERVSSILMGRSFNACRFTLSDTRKIEEFKTFLEREGFSYVGHTGRYRMSVQLEDKQFFESLRSARQQTQYMKVLFPLMFLLAAAVGFAVSALMTGSRRTEIAIIRSGGASISRAFFSFFLEALIQCVIGGGAAWLIMFALGLSVGVRFVICLPLFFVCYLAGAAFSMGSTVRQRISSIIKTKE